ARGRSSPCRHRLRGGGRAGGVRERHRSVRRRAGVRQLASPPAHSADIVTALRQCRKTLRRGGLLLCSVRDYDDVPRGEPAVHPYGERRWGGDVYRLRQEWTWDSTTHYQVRFVVEELDAAGPGTVLDAVTR